MTLWFIVTLFAAAAPIMAVGRRDTAAAMASSVNCSAKVVAERCPSDLECSRLSVSCMHCDCPTKCGVYGGNTSLAICTVPRSIDCEGNRSVEVPFTCQYCYQASLITPNVVECEENFDCSSIGSRSVKSNDAYATEYRAKCRVAKEVLCLGKREFYKQEKCNWTSGYKWTTALALSVFLGGFGADRFYLGHWQEGIGKLFSFGGLGVWTLVDVVMVAIRYIGPSDGSLYI